MTKTEKNQQIDALAKMLAENSNFYITDTSALNSEVTTGLRRACFTKNIKMLVVKNTLLQKAMERSGDKYTELYTSLKGNSTILFSESMNEPGKLIKEFRKKNAKPLLKGAWVAETVYLGDDQLTALASIKTKNELIADVIAALQSPIQNVMSGITVHAEGKEA
jgi:large subunit ribosomal protein L10